MLALLSDLVNVFFSPSTFLPYQEDLLVLTSFFTSIVRLLSTKFEPESSLPLVFMLLHAVVQKLKLAKYEPGTRNVDSLTSPSILGKLENRQRCNTYSWSYSIRYRRTTDRGVYHRTLYIYLLTFSISGLMTYSNSRVTRYCGQRFERWCSVWKWLKTKYILS